MKKLQRHLAIKQLLASRAVSTQEDLARYLRLARVKVTQATLSRDLKELGVARLSGSGGHRYELHSDLDDQRVRPLLGFEVEEIIANEQMIVIKTLPGRAQGVAEVIDSFKLPDVLGTIAGDNTIFVSPRSVRRLKSLLSKLKSLVAGRTS